jgi:hypothetical protein
MKYRAIVLTLLLLLSIPAIFAPKASSVNQPALWISPKENVFCGPCIVSTTFAINVNLFNKKVMTGVGIFAYDFKVSWVNNTGILSESMISLVGINVHIPWPVGSYFIVANETYTDAAGISYYHLAVTAIGGPELELTEVQTSLVTLTFHIDNEPCWPEIYSNWFHLLDVSMSTQCTGAITDFELDDATYELDSAQPDIHLFSAEKFFPYNITEKCICNTHVVEVHLSNITDAFAFGVSITWDPDFLETDIQKITLCTAFPAPYEWLVIDVEAGSLYVELWRPCEKPTVCSSDTCILSIAFHAISPQLEQIPSNWDSSISIQYAWIVQKCPDYRFYDYPFGDLVYGGDLPYLWRPNRADLNLDCKVDVSDLSALAKQYDKVHPWGALAASGNTAVVDIYDFVYVAKHYGEDP